MSLLDDLTPEPTTAQIEALVFEFQQWIRANIPSLDPLDPVINAVIINPWVDRIAKQANRVDTLVSMTELSDNALSLNLTTTQEEALAEFLSEFHGLEAREESYATGHARVTFTTTSPSRYFIPSNTVFQTGDISFRNSQSYKVVTAAAATGDQAEVILRKHSDSEWYVIIPLVAIDPGSSGNIPRGTILTSGLSLTASITTEAENAFTGGASTSTLAAVVAEVKDRQTSRVLYTREQIVSYIKGIPDLGRVAQVGVVGFGDTEMKRDTHPFLPLQRAGMCDVYVASAAYPTRQTVILTGSVVDTSNETATITIPIGSGDLPAYLMIESLLDIESDMKATDISEIRGFSVPTELNVMQPLIRDAKHASFSAYQTATIKAKFPGVQSLQGSQRSIEVVAIGPVGIDAAQTAVSSRLQRALGGDILVRSAIPIFLNITVVLGTQYELEVPNVEEMVAAIVREVSNRPMRAQITLSDISRVLVPYLSDDVFVSSVRFDGELIMTTGQTINLFGTNLIECPYDAAEQLSSRTCAFYVDTPSISFEYTRVLAANTP